MSNLSWPSGSGTAMSVARRLGAPMEHSTGSAALAAGSSGKYMRVTTRSSRPRANTDTSRCGASMLPSEVGSGPGLSVTMRYEPSGAVGHRPKPRKLWYPPGVAPRGSSGWAKRPSGPACQVSISPSGMMFPAPSKSRPMIVIAPGVPSGTTNGPSGHGSRIEKYGPTVWEGVIGGTRSAPLLEDGRVAAAQHDVPVVAEGPLWLGQLDVEVGDQPLPGLLVGHRVED